jgi:hypothetical protein
LLQGPLAPLPPEYNDDTVQLNFTGLRYDVDGKIWTKSVGTQHIFRLDLATNKWERRLSRAASASGKALPRLLQPR